MQNPDLSELKQLVLELRAEHVAQKEKEKKERWTKYVSLTMVIMAVLAAFTSMKGGGFSSRTLKEMNEATYNETQASDQWSYYEAKSIKQNLYEIELEHLTDAPNPDAAAVARLKAKLAKYEQDRTDITAQAKKLEAARDDARAMAAKTAQHSSAMGLAITLYQIAIALGAMCMIVKKKPLWIASLVLAALATGRMIYVAYVLPM